MVSILIDNEMLLRTYQLDDAPELFRAINESREHLRPWFDWVDQTLRPEHSQQFIQQSLVQMQYQESIALGIFHKRRIIGSIGMHHWDHKLKKAQLGYWLTKEYEGKGILHTCLTRFIDFLFEKPGLNKIEIHFIPQNVRSASAAERLGFKVEGVIRQSSLRNGMLEDVVITGLLKNEWLQRSHRS